jgi:hypothetical protein
VATTKVTAELSIPEDGVDFDDLKSFVEFLDDLDVPREDIGISVEPYSSDTDQNALVAIWTV